MRPLYLRPLPRPSTRNLTKSIEDFYAMHPPFKSHANDGVVLLLPSPITSREDLEQVIAKIREVASV